MDRIIVLEVNEIPKRVLDWWADRSPASATARLLRVGTLCETVLDEELPRDLYPSQSWASVGMGVPHARHGVFWYGDPKPSEFPFYWQAAASAGRSVGLMGVLHSSPRSMYASGPNYSFVVPDLFGDDASTHPATLQAMQEVSLRMTRQSARVASMRPSVADLKGAVSFARNGVKPSTWAEITMMTAQVARGAWNRERLRVAQSLLVADVFERQVREHDPDLAVIFLNHVAAFMHRYWASTFPGDWPNGSGYSDEWIARNADELPYAMQAFDRILEQLLDLASSTGRDLMLVSSMGQKADTTVNTGNGHQAVVRRPDQFLAAAGLAPGQEIRSAMVPQLTVVAASSQDEQHICGRLEQFLGAGLNDLMSADENGRRVITFSYAPPVTEATVLLGDRWRDPSEVGMSIEVVEDHRSGRHSNRGVVVSTRVEQWPDEIDAFDVAPMLLDRLDVPALAHHRAVTVS